MYPRRAPDTLDPASPVGRLILALGLEVRTTATVQDMYSRPIVVVAPARAQPRRPAEALRAAA